MTDFPYDIALGLGIVLLGTLGVIVWILMLDHLEKTNATQERIQPENDQQKH